MRALFVAGFAASLLVTGAAVGQDKPQYGSFGIDLSSMDKSVKPGDNFFEYVNGGWRKTAVIDPARSQTGSFQDLQILSETRLGTLVDELDKKPGALLNPEEITLRDLY